MKAFLSVACVVLGVAAAAPAAEVADLAQQLKSPDVDQRRAAARSLSEMGSEAKPAVPELVKALKDPDLFVRRFSAQALGEIGPDAHDAIPALKGSLSDGRKEVVLAAAGALGKLGPDGVTALVGVVKDRTKDVEVRRAAVTALAAAGSNARDAVPVLIRVVKGAPPSKPDKGKMDTTESMELRVDAAQALGDLGAEAKEAVPTLQDLASAKGKNPLKIAANDALRKITGQGAKKK